MTALDQLDGESRPVPSSRRPVRTWVIIETILAVPAVALGGFVAMMSVMMFDAPGSTSNTPLILLFLSIVAFPFACIAAVVSAWIAIVRKRDRAALWLSLLPLLPVLTGVLAAVWLQFG